MTKSVNVCYTIPVPQLAGRNVFKSLELLESLLGEAELSEKSDFALTQLHHLAPIDEDAYSQLSFLNLLVDEIDEKVFSLTNLFLSVTPAGIECFVRDPGEAPNADFFADTVLSLFNPGAKALRFDFNSRLQAHSAVY